MDIFCDAEDIRSRFEQYVADLRRLFVFHGIPCGSAEGFAALGVKLEESKAFRLDLPALLRSLHELAGDRMTAEEMLTMLALASGGADLVDGRAETVGLRRNVTLLRVLVAGAGAWSEQSEQAGAEPAVEGRAELRERPVEVQRGSIERSLEQLQRQVSEIDRRMHRLEPAVAGGAGIVEVGGVDEPGEPLVVVDGAGEATVRESAWAGVTGGAAAAEDGVVARGREVRRVHEVEPGYAQEESPDVVAAYAAARALPVRSGLWLPGSVAAVLFLLIASSAVRVVSSRHARTIFAKSGATAGSAAPASAAPASAEMTRVATASAPAARVATTSAPASAAPTGAVTRSVAGGSAAPAVVRATEMSPTDVGAGIPMRGPAKAVRVETPVPASAAGKVVAAKAVAEDAAVAPAIVPVQPAVMERQLVTSRKPVFPATALAKGMDGTVVLNTFIAKNGSVSRMDVISGAPPFIDSAMAAVSWRRYRPYLLRGRPVAVVTPVTVVYRLP